MNKFEDRIDDIERRLARLEHLINSLQTARAPTPTSTPTPRTQTPIVDRPAVHVSPRTSPSLRKSSNFGAESTGITITKVLGWTGVTALVIAAAYLIGLAVEVGWLTPIRQIGLAIISGLSLIAAGIWLRNADRNYASLLPASGLVVLFLSIYGAHLYYHYISINAAVGAIIVVCIASLWLNRLFESELYALFAVVGSYSAPFLLKSWSVAVFNLAIYYTAWSIIFCIFAIWNRSRRVYLLAAYMALLGFYIIWHRASPNEWQAALFFQVIQFAIFLSAAVYFSIRHKSPMENEEAIAHMPLLLLFYVLQYSLLRNHLPVFAPWIALGSAAFLLLTYYIAKMILDMPMQSGRLLVGSYVALALFHAGYIQLIPTAYTPWVGLLALAAVALYLWRSGGDVSGRLPVMLLAMFVFFLNYLRVIANMKMMHVVPAHEILAVLYAVELYIAYYFTRQDAKLSVLSIPTLYAGHIALMAATEQIIDSRLGVSFAWSVIAITCLVLSFYKRDTTLGKSSLIIFAASAAKVLLFDLSETTPLVRILSLFVLGVSLYLGGWLYKKIDRLETA